MLDVIGHHARGAFAGNSSAGIKETPAFRCPGVNIGPRQHGRLRGDNVLDVALRRRGAIEAAARRCVDDEEFRAACAPAAIPTAPATPVRASPRCSLP